MNKTIHELNTLTQTKPTDEMLVYDVTDGTSKKTQVKNLVGNYSETETLTGATWIDEKPIYRRVYKATLGSSANIDFVVGEQQNVDSVVSLRFILKTTTFASEGAIYTGSTYTPFNIGFYSYNTKKVTYKNVVPSYFGSQITAIMEYTKTS